MESPDRFYRKKVAQPSFGILYGYLMLVASLSDRLFPDEVDDGPVGFLWMGPDNAVWCALNGNQRVIWI